jgi:ketosteroid isomerase-like protein
LTISNETLTAIKQAYHIWAESQGDDVSRLLDLMADDVEVTTLPDGTDPLTFTKACRNKVEMTEYFQALVGDWCVLRADIDDMVQERDLVVLVLTTVWCNRRTDMEFESPAAHVWRFRDGFACQVRLFFDSAKWSQAACPD